MNGWRRRLKRADKHLREVEGAVAAFLAEDPYRVTSTLKPHPLVPRILQLDVRGHVDKEPDPEFADVVGDVIENLRSSLDLLAYRLASGQGEPPPMTEFPIFWREADFRRSSPAGKAARGSGLYKVRGMVPAAQAAIEALQPYQGVTEDAYTAAGEGVIPEEVALHPLQTIHGLRQINFHQRGHLTGAIASGFGIQINHLHGVAMKINGAGPNLKAGAFRDNARLAYMEFSIAADDHKMDMSWAPEFDVVFEAGPPGFERSVVETLRAIHDHLDQVVFPRLEPFA